MDAARLPLSDRILLALGVAPATARRLSRNLGADISDVYRALRVLQASGALERVTVPRAASDWRLAPGVRVRFEPARIVVEGARPPARPPNDVGSGNAQGCTAVTRGRYCRLPAGADGRCYAHGGRAYTLPAQLRPCDLHDHDPGDPPCGVGA